MGKRYWWIVRAPDGRVIFRDCGGRDVEARAKGAQAQFNASLPWHVKEGAKVEMHPEHLPTR